MPARSVIGSLMTEHRLIDRVIVDVERRLDLAASGTEVQSAYIVSLIDFVLNYADRCHHGKEEQILFRQLEAKDIAPEHADTMAELVREHQAIRDLAGSLDDANVKFMSGDKSVVPRIEQSLREITAIYPAHVEKEERHFFKPAISYFTKEERDAMAEEFRAFDQELIHEKYRRTVEELEASMAGEAQREPALR